MDTANKIAELNDRLRKNTADNPLGRGVITQGVTVFLQEHDTFGMTELMQRIADYDSFTEDNDPHGEHDFGVMMIGDEKLFWKIDIYADQNCILGSPHPADQKQSYRVLTVMLAGEY